MRLVTATQAAEIDSIAQTQYNLTAELLMEVAGSQAAQAIQVTCAAEACKAKGVVTVLCGPGHNGADGLVVARHLRAAGWRQVRAFVLRSSSTQTSSLWSLQRQRAEQHGVQVVEWSKDIVHSSAWKDSVLWVDAIFGIGLNKQVEAPFADLVRALNSAKGCKVSLDVPSGLDVNTGVKLGVAVRADKTLTFGAAKPGFFVNEGPQCVGDLRVLSIGWPKQLVQQQADTHFLLTKRQARHSLPHFRATANKSQHGRCWVIAGHPGMWGAGVLACQGAYRMGAGYVVWVASSQPPAQLKFAPEILTLDRKIFRAAMTSPLATPKPTAIAIGSGLPPDQETAEWMVYLQANHADLPVVVDAGAFTACVEHDLFPLPSRWIVTPHAGELSRLLGISAAEIEQDRFAAAQAAAEKTKCLVLLKGYHTIVASGKKCWIIPTGNSALGKAGTGDVLTGMMAGLLAQGVPPLPAAATAAYVHGKIADEWVRQQKDRMALSASDLLQMLPSALADLRKGGKQMHQRCF